MTRYVGLILFINIKKTRGKTKNDSYSNRKKKKKNNAVFLLVNLLRKKKKKKKYWLNSWNCCSSCLLVPQKAPKAPILTIIFSGLTGFNGCTISQQLVQRTITTVFPR